MPYVRCEACGLQYDPVIDHKCPAEAVVTEVEDEPQ